MFKVFLAYSLPKMIERKGNQWRVEGKLVEVGCTYCTYTYLSLCMDFVQSQGYACRLTQDST